MNEERIIFMMRFLFPLGGVGEFISSTVQMCVKARMRLFAFSALSLEGENPIVGNHGSAIEKRQQTGHRREN